MSSTALQAAPHQPTSLGSHSPIAATSSNRQYNSASSQSRDHYYSQPPSNASPTSTRRPSKRPSGNGAPSNNQQTQPHYSPSPTSAAVSNHRATTTNHASPVVTTSLPSAHSVMAPGDHQRGVPPVVSPRTSSNRNHAHAGTSRTERRAYANEASSSPRHTGDAQQDREERQASNGMANGGQDDYAAATRARRRAQQSPPEAIPHRPSASHEPRAQSAQRQQATPSSGLSREASEVLNRVIVSKPEVDIEREQERMAEAIPIPIPSSVTAQPPQNIPGGLSDGPDEPRGARSRHDHSASKPGKNSKFGDYYLGAVLGEGEFGKVRMGWKQEGGVQVAVKLIRKDTVGHNPTRLAKVHREIQILREVQHPNIVRLHEMVETENKIGIILEYASGGELFDYILNHRYLKDNAARRLFAQLVSGVGYMHKKGIVHRDLKLENLLLDRNRNIIITDFGFANTFNPADELGDEVEYNLSSRDYIKRMELDKILPNGMRRGDLMQTSCGSPCYAAPELVVSDSLYTGRKVDVWSCGVILYAMLAGYLPFDDDPDNPEGDNINLLYKYIVSTPLTFPEYVTPHARDLLRRILVPDPRKRADLFEVARHSWLSEYSHVVGFITSSNTAATEVAHTHIGSDDIDPTPALARSASVRENRPAKASPAVGELGRKHGNVDTDADGHPKPSKDNKRRTVQVEYVAPRSQTQRGESTTVTAPAGSSKTRARSGSQGPVEVTSHSARRPSLEKPLPKDPPLAKDNRQYDGRRPSSSSRQQGMAPPQVRPGRDAHRATSDTTYLTSNAPPVSQTRPTTGGSMTSNPSRSGSIPLANRGSYSQPAAPAVAGTNAHGRMSQPPPKKNYSISSPTSPDEQMSYGRPSVSQVPQKFAKVSGFSEAPQQEQKSHKRSNTLGSIFSRSNSIFGGKSGKYAAANADQAQQEKGAKKSYPPVSMSNAAVSQDGPRPSMDSRRSISFGFGKKASGSITGGSQTTLSDKPRRFSLLPASFSLKAIGIGKDEYNNSRATQDEYDDRPESQRHYNPPQTARTDVSRVMSGGAGPGHPPHTSDGMHDRIRDSPLLDRSGTSTGSPTHLRYTSQSQPSDPRSGVPPQFLPTMNFRQDQSALTTESESSLNDFHNRRGPYGPYPPGASDYENRPMGSAGAQGSIQTQRQPSSSGRGVLQKPNRKFNDAYDAEHSGNTYGTRHSDHAGSSSAARKVMDFFRRRRRDNE